MKSRLQHRICIFVFIYCFHSLFGSMANAETLTLNSALAAPLTNSEKTGFLDLIAIEAFNRNGLGLALVNLPAERGLKNANAGIEDGELVRVAGMEKIYPNLIPVPEKMMDIDFVAFTNNPSISINGWASLKSYSVGFIRGWKIYERNVPEGTHTILATNAEQLFTVLEKGRIDVALYTGFMGKEIIHRRQMRHVSLSGTPLATKELFMYLHNSHSDWLDGIGAALAQIKAEGLYDKWLNVLETKYSGVD